MASRGVNVSQHRHPQQQRRGHQCQELVTPCRRHLRHLVSHPSQIDRRPLIVSSVLRSTCATRNVCSDTASARTDARSVNAIAVRRSYVRRNASTVMLTAITAAFFVNVKVGAMFLIIRGLSLPHRGLGMFITSQPPTRTNTPQNNVCQ